MCLRVQGIIFVYDITNQPSFQHLAKWVSDVDEVSLLSLIRPFQEHWNAFVMRFCGFAVRSRHRSEDLGGKQM